MTKSNEPQARQELFDSPGSRVVRRAPPRKDAATTDITIPRLETYVHHYEPREPAAHEEAPPPRVASGEAVTRELGKDLSRELARLGQRAGARMRAAVVRLSPVARHARRTLRKHASATLVAASAGLVAGVILSGELGDGPASESDSQYGRRTSSEVGGMCEAPPEPVAPLRPAARQPAATATAITARPAKAQATRPALRPTARSRSATTRSHAAVRKRSAPQAAAARASEAASEARRAALLEEARRAEKAELAEAYFERSARRPRMAGR